VEHGTDLSALDRNTLRTWRVLNLVGWGAAGMLANVLLLIGLSFTTGRLGVATLPSPYSWIYAEILLGLAGAGAGTVVAANVYRSPGFVAGYGAALLWFFAGLLSTPLGNIGSLALIWLVAIPNIACAAIVARRRWERRPSALRRPIDAAV
jgi:hypothetical protein